MVRMGRLRMPFDVMSMRIMLMPWRRSAASGLVRTSANMKSAWWPPVVQIFWPLIMKLSPSRRARVESEARSEPELGSE